MKTINVVFAILVIIIACNESRIKPDLPVEEKGTGAKELQQYSSVEIYCWCFHDEKIASKNGVISSHSKDCETFMPARANSLIKPEHLFMSSKKLDEIVRVQNQIFQNHIGSDTLKTRTEPRFIILLRRNDNYENDTLVYRSGVEFEYNERIVFKFKIGIMDSIRNILKKDIIDCN